MAERPQGWYWSSAVNVIALLRTAVDTFFAREPSEVRLGGAEPAVERSGGSGGPGAQQPSTGGEQSQDLNSS